MAKNFELQKLELETRFEHDAFLLDKEKKKHLEKGEKLTTKPFHVLAERIKGPEPNLFDLGKMYPGIGTGPELLQAQLMRPFEFSIYVDHIVRVDRNWKNVELCFCIQSEGRVIADI
jgi:hypothetical protein